jgi:hypothetical protein
LFIKAVSTIAFQLLYIKKAVSPARPKQQKRILFRADGYTAFMQVANN